MLAQFGHKIVAFDQIENKGVHVCVCSDRACRTGGRRHALQGGKKWAMGFAAGR